MIPGSSNESKDALRRQFLRVVGRRRLEVRAALRNMSDPRPDWLEWPNGRGVPYGAMLERAKALGAKETVTLGLLGYFRQNLVCIHMFILCPVVTMGMAFYSDGGIGAMWQNKPGLVAVIARKDKRSYLAYFDNQDRLADESALRRRLKWWRPPWSGMARAVVSRAGEDLVSLGILRSAGYRVLDLGEV